MDVIDVRPDAEVIPVRWEPCPDGRPDGMAGTLCANCGWPVDEHVDPSAAPTTRAA
jgi:hypothetical protein